MNFQFYAEKLLDSEHFKKFTAEHKDAFACSAFFIIDKTGEDNKQHFDYFLPEDKKMFSFQLEKNCEILPIELNDKTVPEEISLDIDFEFKEIEKKILEKMEQEKIKNKLQKMMFSLQAKNKKHFLIGTIFISNLGMLKVNYDLENNQIIDFEKKSFFDIMKIKRKEKED